LVAAHHSIVRAYRGATNLKFSTPILIKMS
jgi:hypothetical protein